MFHFKLSEDDGNFLNIYLFYFIFLSMLDFLKREL